MFMFGLERRNVSVYSFRKDLISAVSFSKKSCSCDAPKVMNSVVGALKFVQLVSRIAKEPAVTVLKFFSQCTAVAARSKRSL